MSAGSYGTLQDRVRARLGPGDDDRPPRFEGPDGQVKTSAAWLIDKAGFSRGYRMPGPAALSTKHSLAVTNRGSASAADIVALAREICEGVHDAFGVSLANEPVLVGISL
jgi:UDP-N-acetylmuramate dehydrogenase